MKNDFPLSKKEIEAILERGDFTDDQYQRAYDYYVNNGLMPYGVAKARTGDPHNWMFQQLDQGTKS